MFTIDASRIFHVVIVGGGGGGGGRISVLFSFNSNVFLLLRVI